MKRVGKNPKYQHHAFANRAKPAYPGANFDDEGFCVVHNTVRLCELRDDGRYKILRKLCYKCGNTAIVPKGERKIIYQEHVLCLVADDSLGRTVNVQVQNLINCQFGK